MFAGQKKETRRHFRDTESLEDHRLCDTVHVMLRNMFTSVYKYQRHTPPNSPVSYRRPEEQLLALKTACTQTEVYGVCLPEGLKAKMHSLCFC